MRRIIRLLIPVKFIPLLTSRKIHPSSPLEGRFILLPYPGEIHPSSHSKESSSFIWLQLIPLLTPGKIYSSYYSNEESHPSSHSWGDSSHFSFQEIHPSPHSMVDSSFPSLQGGFILLPTRGENYPSSHSPGSFIPFLTPDEIHPSPHSIRGLSFPLEGRFILLPTLGKNHPSSQGKFIPVLTPGKVHPTSHFKGDLSFFPLQGRFIPLFIPRKIKIHPSPHSREIQLSPLSTGDPYPQFMEGSSYFTLEGRITFLPYPGRFIPFLQGRFSLFFFQGGSSLSSLQERFILLSSRGEIYPSSLFRGDSSPFFFQGKSISLLTPGEIHPSSQGKFIPHFRKVSSFPLEGSFILLPTPKKNHPSSQGNSSLSSLQERLGHPSHSRVDLSFFPFQGRVIPLLKDNSSLIPGKVRSSHSRRDIFSCHL